MTFPLFTFPQHKLVLAPHREVCLKTSMRAWSGDKMKTRFWKTEAQSHEACVQRARSWEALSWDVRLDDSRGTEGQRAGFGAAGRGAREQPIPETVLCTQSCRKVNIHRSHVGVLVDKGSSGLFVTRE